MSTEKPRKSPEYQPQRGLASRAAESIIKSAIFISCAQHYGLYAAYRFTREREQHLGLLEGSLVASRLAYPNPDGSFNYQPGQDAAYRWYDPLRNTTFPNRPSDAHAAGEGSLFMFYPDELAGNDEAARTPLWYLQPFSVEHLSTFDKCSPDEMLGRQVLKSTTMAEAYERLGLVEFAEELERRNLASERVFQVTPKGNTLITPIRPGGDRSPKRETETSFVPISARFA